MKLKLALRRTNLEEQLYKSRKQRISSENVLQQVQEIFEQEAVKADKILEEIHSGSAGNNNFNLDLLESNRIFHLSDIEKLCIDYRLRFLDSGYFKGEIPYEAVSRIKAIEKEQQISLKGFKIVAPSKLFKLENADDPLLFAPMGNDYFYLIHKWGNDLHPLRKLLMWPFRHLENFIGSLLVLSFILALLIPDGLFSPQQTTTQFFMIFFFVFKWVAGLAIFYGFKKGKNFSSAIWRSKYYNA
ncbi:hypothetical protein APR41_16275 [Salegentibacter salinarum]|uniref:Uncharacterized protein n=1 Tax=Salegentibacter salinarum TaxID=447422 RepID=A0A2N0TXH5_9FLAO|nr:hypothetical protein [Salegentibacter salinarum]PKD19358.1 hypothetical protein APR41_16275 [Salegentibacter salinarum]